MASASGAVVAKFFHSEPLFNLFTDGWRIHSIPYYTLLAMICGLLSVYMMRMTIRTESAFKRIKTLFPKAILGGILLGLLIFIFPPLYGEGYGLINKLMNADQGNLFDRSLFYVYRDNVWVVIGFSTAILLIKVFASAITVGSGGNGGIIGPSLFVGALLGFIFVKTLGALGIVDLRMQNFVAAGMAGLVSGVLHAPLTAIFLIAEITGGYALIVPLMLVSSGSYFITRYFEKYSIYTKNLIERGFITFDKDKDLLSRVDIRSIIQTDFTTLSPNQTLGELVGIISTSKRNIFVVLDGKNHLLGIITLDDIREIMFNQTEYNRIKVKKLMSIPRYTVLPNADVNELIEQKIDKEANRYIQQWPELKLSIENGRWGPYVRHGKKMLKLSRPGKSKFTPEEAAVLSIEEVKAIVEGQVPGAFDKKVVVKKSAPKKAAPKKAAAKKAVKR
jgi:CIC family chloride channel protein